MTKDEQESCDGTGNIICLECLGVIEHGCLCPPEVMGGPCKCKNPVPYDGTEESLEGLLDLLQGD